MSHRQNPKISLSILEERLFGSLNTRKTEEDLGEKRTFAKKTKGDPLTRQVFAIKGI